MQEQSRYELIRRLAAGGMGEVFVARRVGAAAFEKRVALKLMQPHLLASPELVERFYAEARLAARMHHPNIVEIFDVGEADGRPFLAMQLVTGVSLSQLEKALKARGERVPLPIARLIATGLCEALSYAHTLTDSKNQPLNVVHRDVTPSNVLVSSAGQVLLTDFGIAQASAGASFTEPGVVRGKAAYLAPEQVLHDARVDARADVYAAALTLYELLTLENPYRKPTVKESMDAVARGGVAPITTLRDDVPREMQAALERALAREVGARFATARQFREAFADGPTATAPELASYVQQVCGRELAALEVPDDAPATRSVVLTVTPTQLTLPAGEVRRAPADEVVQVASADVLEPVSPRRGRQVLGVAAAMLIAALLVAGGVRSLTRAQPDAQVPEPPSTIAAHDEVLDAGVAEASAPTKVAEDTPTNVEPPAEASVPVPDTAAPVRAPHGTRRPPPPPKALRVGFLSADAVPWAEVRLGGKVLDRTPFARYPLPVGKHTLTFRGPDGAEQQRVVSVTEGDVTAVRVEFPPRQ